MTSDLWPAPVADRPVDAVVPVPGSKSVTNRALVLAAIADGPSVIRNPLRARDTLLMAQALRALGVGGEDLPARDPVEDGDHDWRVVPQPMRGPASVDVGLAGTVMRFVPPLAALAEGDIAFDGDPRARNRPLGPVIDALRTLGVQVDDGGRGGLPLVVRGTGSVRGGEVVVDASSSSQFVSALLLVGARFDEGVLVRHRAAAGSPSATVPSLPHIAMTVAMLRSHGVMVDDAEPDVWQVLPGPVRPLDLTVEPDLSNAAPFLAAAVVTGGRVTVPHWPASTTQAGDAMRDLLARFGAEVSLGAEGLTVRGTGTIAGIDVDLHEVGELTPTVAAIAALAKGTSTLRGIAHLRHHETDRLAALARELTALGGEVTETDDGLVIHGARALHGGTFATYDDHRLATAGAILGLAVPEVLVENVATTGKTLPGFTDRWSAMLGEDPPA